MRALFVLMVLLDAPPAFAQERPYCPARPGLGDEPCTIDHGRVSIEMGISQWQHDSQGETRTDDWTFGQVLARFGVSSRTEIDLGWTPLAYERQRDIATSGVTHSDGTGDLTLMLKHNLRHPSGDGFSVAVAPYVTLPIGQGPESERDWSAGLIVPISYDLGRGFQLETTSVGASVPNGNGDGHHFQGSATLGLSVQLNKALNTTLEIEALRDDEPRERSTQEFAALSLAWSVSERFQLDLGGAAGIDRAATDMQLYFGVSRLF